MKIVIKNNPPSLTIPLSQVSDDKVYLCISSKGTNRENRWFLKYEKQGWIFRALHSAAGLCGYYMSTMEAVENALSYGEVCEFDTLQEMINYASKGL